MIYFSDIIIVFFLFIVHVLYFFNKISQADVAVLVFSKAFDKFPHSILIQKPNKCNIHSNTVGWIKSFLSNRTQRVVVDGYSSDESAVLSGVPQGSVLGPVLSLIFMSS